MQKFVVEGITWDTFLLVKVVQCHMRAFASAAVGCDERATHTLFRELLQAVEFRNYRSHNRVPSENESLELLRLMRDILHQLKIDSTSVVQQLKHAQDLVGRATDTTDLQYSAQNMAHATREKLVLYIAMREFESRLTVACGNFTFQDDTIAFSSSRFRDKEIFESRRKWVKLPAAKDALKTIAQSRHWLFHNTSEQVQVVQVLAKMSTVLCNMLQPEPQPVDVGWSSIMSNTGSSSSEAIEVELVLSPTSMRIPAAKERCIVHYPLFF